MQASKSLGPLKSKGGYIQLTPCPGERASVPLSERTLSFSVLMGERRISRSCNARRERIEAGYEVTTGIDLPNWTVSLYFPRCVLD
jgi:hypothetical protein